MKLLTYSSLIACLLFAVGSLHAQDPGDFYDPQEEIRRLDSLYEHNPDVTRKEVITFLNGDNLRRNKAYYGAYQKRMKRKKEKKPKKKKKNQNSTQQVQTFATEAATAQAANEGNVPDAVEYAALEALYEATRGFQWPKQDNWLQGSTSADMGTWFGIATRGGDVVRIVLEFNRLKDALPPELANLTQLEELRFGNNLLTGVDPAIGSLPNLKRLILSKNRIASLPPQLGNLPVLEQLWLRNNRLTQLPPQIGNLSTLTFLSLFDNRLTSLPTTIGQLSSLTYLGLRNNQLTTLPGEISSLSNLEQLWVRDNQLTEVPPAVTQLSALKKLSFYGNQLIEVPAALGQLSQLQDLRLIKNQLSSLPETLPQLPNLQKLTIFDNRIDLNDIARFLSGPDSYTYTQFEYRPQANSPDTISVSDPTGAPTLDPYVYQHPQSLFQWQRQLNGSWQDIAGATEATYTVEASTARYYRCRLTSNWLDNMIQYSAVYEVSTPPTFFLEAECATVGANWQTVGEVTASAGQYLVYPSGNSPNTAPGQAADQVRFSVTLDQPGSFFVLARVRTSAEGSSAFWVRVNEGSWQYWDEATAEWDWQSVSKQASSLRAGVNTVAVAYGQGGAQLDKLYLSVSATAPAGVGEADKQCTGQPLALWQEAECVTYGSFWDQVTDEEASGQSLLQANTAYSGGLGANAAERLVAFSVETPQPGTYHLFARHYNGSNPESSFSVRVNGGPWIDWTPEHGGSLSWSPVLGTALVLEGGSNTVTFRNRFKDSQLDKLFISSESTLPTGAGEADTTCVPYVAPPPPSIANNPPDGSTAPGLGGSRPAGSSNSNVNYVRSFTPRVEIGSAGSVAMSQSVNNVRVSTEYLDGLGRPIQTVVRGGSGSAGQDLVQPVEYDAFGRQPKQHLPYAASSASGAFRPNGLPEQYDFYRSGTPPTWPAVATPTPKPTLKPHP